MDFSEQKNHPTIIIDFGSDTIKFGFNLELYPPYIIPNMIGKLKPNLYSPLKTYNDRFCGYDALNRFPSLDISYPLIDHNGKFISEVENLNDFEALFHYIFKEKLQVEEINYNLFIINSIFTSPKEHETMVQLLFEKFHTYNLIFQPQSIMTLYSTAKTSGLIVNSGEIFTEIVPIYEGYIISNCINKFPFGGYELTKKFMEKYKNDFEINNVCDRFHMGQKIKEKFCEILPSHKDYEDVMNKKDIINKEYCLPDGSVIKIGNEIYEIPEALFSPEILNFHSKNLPQLIVDSINKSSISIRKELFNNIILGGGNTCIKGFDSRLKSEINNLKKRNCGIISLDERRWSAWIGASRISTSGNFEGQWISRSNYFSNVDLPKNDYLFNYSGLIVKKMDNINEDEYYKRYIIKEQI